MKATKEPGTAPGSAADQARAEGDALMDEQIKHAGEYERRQALIDQAHRAYERGFAPPQLTPKKREPDTYCFRCGAPVPGGLFITNSRKGGRNFSWVNVDGLTWRSEGAHTCPTANELLGPLFADPQLSATDEAEANETEWYAVHGDDDGPDPEDPEEPAPLVPPRPAIEREIIERYATSEEERDDGLELLDTAALVDHLALSMGQLEQQIKRTPPGPDRDRWQATLDQVIADAEALIDEHSDRQLDLAL